jgi:hypothetical protein
MRTGATCFLAIVLLAGCVSTRVAQRDGCWVKRTERIFGQVHEEVGPCARPAPQWANDRLTRLVQECVVQADHRWQTRALSAWNQGRPLPVEASDEDTLHSCMEEASRSMVTENEALRERVAELAHDREGLRASVNAKEAHLTQSHDKLADYLGEAAKRPPGSAVATAKASSDGTARTANEAGSPAPASVLATPLPVSCSPSSTPAAKPARARKVKAQPPKCDPPPAAQNAAAPGADITVLPVTTPEVADAVPSLPPPAPAPK